MSSGNQKVIVGLLIVVVALQVWLLGRQAGLAREIRQTSQAAQHAATQAQDRWQEVDRQLNRLQAELATAAEAQRWVSQPRVTVEPTDDCSTARVQVSWNLMQWSPGSSSQLLYRLREEETWRALPILEGEGQGYTSTFTVPAEWRVRPSISIGYERGRSEAAVAAQATEVQAQPDPLFRPEYQIVAEGPLGGRSTGPQPLDLGRWFYLPVHVAVNVGAEGRYQVRVEIKADPGNACLSPDRVAVRTYAGTERLSDYQLDEGPEDIYHGEWQSRQPLSRLEVQIQHGGWVERIPVHL